MSSSIFFYASLVLKRIYRTAITLYRYKKSSRMSVSFWNENPNKLIQKWLVSKKKLLESFLSNKKKVSMLKIEYL